MRLFKAALLSLGLLISIKTFANPYFDMTISSALPIPANVLVGKTMYADILVQNIDPRGQDFTFQFDPSSTDSHFTDVPNFTPLPGEPTACHALPGGVLANQATCTARVAIEGDTAISDLPTDPLNSGIYGACAVFPGNIKYCDHLISPKVNIVPVLPEPIVLSANPISLMPGVATTVTITNTSTDQVAENVIASMPSNVTVNSGECDAIPAGGTCDMNFTLSSADPTLPSGSTATFQGTNTNPLTVPVTSAAFVKVQVTGVHFTQPGTLGVQVSNLGSVSLNGLSASLNSAVHNVTAGSGDEACGETLAPNTSCNFYYTAASDAYGTSPVTVTYSTSVSGTQSDDSQNVQVDPTTIVMDPASILADTNTLTGSFAVKNTGKFSWITPHVTRPDSDDWLTLSPDPQKGCPDEVSPGAACNMIYKMATPFGLSSSITADGQNAASVSADFTPINYFIMGAEKDATYQHYQYASIYVKNLTNVPVALDSLTTDVPSSSSLSGKVMNCDQAGANCDPAVISSDVCKVGGSLAPNGGECHIWYKMNTLLPAGSAGVKVTVVGKPDGGADRTIYNTFQFCFQNSVVAGGGNRTNGFLDMWNGSSWEPIGAAGDIQGSVNSLAIYKGDLYVGGEFSQVGNVANTNLIARWNGNIWAPVAQGLLSDTQDMPTVNALYNDDANHILYVGGYFSNDKATQASMSDIGYWDGSQWHAMGNGIHSGNVSAITGFDGQVVVGGNFTYVNKAGADGLAIWSPTSSAWTAIPFAPAASANSNNQIYTLTSNGSAIYVGGQFTVKVGADTVMNIMSLVPKDITQEEFTLVPLKGTVDTGSASSPVNALLADGNNIYIGGGGFSIDGQFFQHLTQYAISQGVFSDVGSGNTAPLGQVQAITLSSNGLYIGQGKSTTPQSFAMQWDGTNWASLGSGTSLPGTVDAEIMLPQLVINNSGQGTKLGLK